MSPEHTTDNCDRDKVICDGHQELRDIVIETRTDIKYIRESIDRINNNLDVQEKRLGYLEVNGAKISQDNAKDIKLVSARVEGVEKTCLTSETEHKTEKTWVDTTYAKIGIVGGILISIVFGIAGYFK
jgi:hypothetical protein